jgi:hypothetical protein
MSSQNPAELPPQLEAVIGQIRAALVPGADVATKGAAAHACRVLLGVLEAQPGQPIQVGGAAPAAATPAAPVVPVVQGPIDLFLARFVEKFGADLPPPDPSVPYLNLGRAGAVLAQSFGAMLGGVR